MKSQFGAFSFSMGQKVEAHIKRRARDKLQTDTTGLRKLDRAFQGLAASTCKSYRALLGIFDGWRDGRPLSDETVADYIQHLHKQGRAPGSIKQALGAIRFRCRALGQPDPTGDETTAMMRNVVRRGRDRGKGSAPGLTYAEVLSIIESAENGGSLWSLRDAALVAVQFFAGLRISEVSALRVSDIRFSGDGTAVLTIRSSKTDQGGQGVVQFLPSDAVTRVRAWLAAAEITNGPLFRAIQKTGFDAVVPTIQERSLSRPHCAEIVKKRAQSVGLVATSHSLRRAYAMWLTAEGASIQQVQTAGRWKQASMVAVYTADLRATESFIRNISEKRKPRLRVVNEG